MAKARKRRVKGYWHKLADKMSIEDSVKFDNWRKAHSFICSIKNYYTKKIVQGEYNGRLPVFKLVNYKDHTRVWRIL